MTDQDKAQAERQLQNPNHATADRARADSTVFGQRSVVRDERPPVTGPAVPAKSRG